MYKIRDMSFYPSERERKGPSYVTNKYKKKTINYKQTELILCTTNPLRQKRKKTKTELQQICLPGSF
jgi:murein L,D-transpeptidase YafK